MSLLRPALVAAGLMTTMLAAQTEFKSWSMSQAPADLRARSHALIW
jgi:hypothetical protein